MAMEDLEGTTYGPYPFRTDPEKVAEYTEIAGADAGSEHGPRHSQVHCCSVSRRTCSLTTAPGMRPTR
jgi:hypothetical protein